MKRIEFEKNRKKIEICLEEKVREEDSWCWCGVVKEDSEVVSSFECDVIENESEDEFLKRMKNEIENEK